MSERYDENAPGPFYIEKDLCIACRNPESVAPDLIGFVEDATAAESHCHFKRQPETADEVSRAIQAICNNCCGSYRYSGNDAEIKERLLENGRGDAIEE